jgi:hypothetical protein
VPHNCFSVQLNTTPQIHNGSEPAALFIPNLALRGGQWLVSGHRTFYYQGKNSTVSHSTEGWVGPRTDIGAVLRGTGSKLSGLHIVLLRLISEGESSGVMRSKQKGRLHKSLTEKPEKDISLLIPT